MSRQERGVFFTNIKKKYGKPGVALAIVSLVAACNLDSSPTQEVFRGDEGARPYSHLDFQNDPDDFQFAVVGDRTGGARNGVFSASIDLLNLIRPEFVVNVGDLIEGYVEDEAELKTWWTEIDNDLKRLDMPFFYVPGNHDVNFDPSEKVWFERAGADRGYSYFVYKDVLFLLISTEDPPKNQISDEMADNYDRVKAGQVDAKEAQAIIEELEEWAGQPSISDTQVEFFRDVLAANPDVRWTIGFMHSPAWAQPDPGNFAKIEALLQDRPYTMFGGHTHTYNYVRRNGRDYVTMGATGALLPADQTTGNMDHVAWVTMTDEGPVVSNLLLNGILDKRGSVPTLQDFGVFRPRQITQTGKSLGIGSVPNLRDLGGYETDSGSTVASGLLYRSNQLSGISSGDMRQLAGLKLENAYDLRTTEERDKRPEELPDGVDYVVVDVLADSPQAGPAQLEKLMADPQVANAELGGGKVEAGFEASYREFVSLPSAQREFGNMFLALGDETELPALFHCTTGKDRTGWAAAAFLTLMGVPRETVYEDYLRSNDYILPAYQEVIDGFVVAGGDAEIPRAILGVKKEYLDAAFDEMETEYGSIEQYFSKALGIGSDRQQAMRDMYLK
jgi:protein tyrosine/serine phosphatase